MGAEVLEAAGTTAWTPRDHVRAFYSGHSLNEGVPEIVEQIARSLGYRRDFESRFEAIRSCANGPKGPA